MTLYENIQILKTKIVNVAAEVAAYKWNDSYSKESIKNVWENVDATFNRKLDFKITKEAIENEFSKEQILEFFQSWNGEIYLIPLWFYNYIPDGETLICIDGNERVKGIDYIDLDNRMGFIAFGWKFKQMVS